MDAWEQWWNMAQGSLKAAQALEETKEHRSSASRAYYAAYQAATALLLYARRIPPAGREAWSHEATPELVKDLPSALLLSAASQDMRKRLSSLYDLRIVADYHGGEDVEELTLRESVRSAAFVIRILGSILPKREKGN